MQRAAEERLVMLRDTYGPGWVESDESLARYPMKSAEARLLTVPSRTRKYIPSEQSRAASLSSTPSQQHPTAPSPTEEPDYVSPDKVV